MLVHDEPLAILLFKYDGPAECRQLPFTALQRGVLFYRRGTPSVVSCGVDLGIIIDGEGSAFVSGELFFYAALVFLLAAILERGNVKESVIPLGVELGYTGRVERAPAVPDFLQIGFVGERAGGGLAGSFLGCSKA